MKPNRKPVTYEQLIGICKKVLLTIQVASIDGLRIDGEKIKVKGIHSRLYLYGGTAPTDMRQLLTFHELHKCRLEWMNRLFPYFEPFIPGLTRKEMWNAIKERRKVYANDREKKMRRKEARQYDHEPKETFIDCSGAVHRDSIPLAKYSQGNTNRRLFPMQSHKYIEWMAMIDYYRLQKFENCASLEGACFSYRYHENDEKPAKLKFNDEPYYRSEFAMAENFYCWGWGIDFRLVVSKGRIFIESGPGSHQYILAKNYATIAGKERILNAKKEEEERINMASDSD
jgi:hypothetical protein